MGQSIAVADKPCVWAQLQGVLLVFKFIFVVTVVLWFVEVDTCWSFITTWTGLLPLQIVGAALAWQLCWYYMPKDPKSHMLMQVRSGHSVQSMTELPCSNATWSLL